MELEIFCSAFSCWILVLSAFLRVSGNTEGDALNALKTNLADPNNVLHSWDATLVNPCSWYHITCNDQNSVTNVDLGNKNLSGQLVSQLGQLRNLQYLELYSNNISGIIPKELGDLTNLVSLDLYLNSLSGPIPDTLSKLTKLHFLRLNNNRLTGSIPISLTAISSLQVLDLSNNYLTGDIPRNGSFAFFAPTSFANNHLNRFVDFLPSSMPLTQQMTSGNRSIGFIAGFVALGVSIACAIALACWHRKRSWKRFSNRPAEEDSVLHLGQLKRFSLHQLQIATNNFSNKNILGRTGLVKLYKGRLTDGSLVVVKRLEEKHTWGAERQFQTEVELISLAVHKNVVRLLGFCMTPTERLLVYPFMVNGTVASCLKEQTDGQCLLDWPTRKRIALGSATGLAYLHDSCDPKVIHRDVKAENILLDKQFEAVVAGFGLAKLMAYKDTHVTTAVHGTLGHVAPEYISTGRYSEKTDLYGYGIMLLELITGKKTFDLARLATGEDVSLLNWVRELMENKKLETLVDSKLQGNYIVKEVEELIQVALLCTKGIAADRPKMSEVVKMLEGDGLAERWEEWQNKDVIGTEMNHITLSYHNWIINDSTPGLHPEELSGPR